MSKSNESSFNFDGNTKLSSDSEEYKNIEKKLRINTGKPNLQIKSVSISLLIFWKNEAILLNYFSIDKKKWQFIFI